MGEFNNVVSYVCKAYNQTTEIVQSVSDQATWYRMRLSDDPEEADITKIVEKGSIGTDLYGGKFIVSQLGVYFFNLGFSFMGSASANYKIRATLNGTQIDQSVCQFTTRGTNVRWEVGMTFLVDLGYRSGTETSGLYSSKNDIEIGYQNVLGEGDLDLVNGIYNVMKIG
tara:strand:+ start:14277 stop:14783 length:507 start_codon:yes stop_codon:yes gene_type:complete